MAPALDNWRINVKRNGCAALGAEA